MSKINYLDFQVIYRLSCRKHFFLRSHLRLYKVKRSWFFSETVVILFIETGIISLKP